MAIPQFYESFLFDWGDDVAPRVSIVPEARMVPDVDAQIAALFQDGWDHRRVVLVDRRLPEAGTPGAPVAPFARILQNGGDHVIIEAGVGPDDGYLLFLDSYSADWRVSVDGRASTMARADGLFRAVRLPRGRHRLEFTYRPRTLVWGAAVSFIAALFLIGLAGASDRFSHRREEPLPHRSRSESI
jgi:hypothetical protein